jgi:predicted GIY-YIG superfamily endonuclease
MTILRRPPLATLVAVAMLLSSGTLSWADSPANDELAEVVRQAFREVHNGFSSDEVIASDDLNAAFIASCRQTLPDADEFQLNWTLLTLRKAGHLDVKATKRAALKHNDYRHAAEIAARLMHDRHELSMDRVLCDPERRREFDSVAQGMAPEVSAYQLRKAALGLRKARQLRPELVLRVADWKKEVITHAANQLKATPERIPTGPGIYIFRDTSGYLYIGESANLRTRLTKHLDESDRLSLASYLKQQQIEQVTLELHVFDPKSNARHVSMRRAYESELIRSRKPRFNVAP